MRSVNFGITLAAHGAPGTAAVAGEAGEAAGVFGALAGEDSVGFSNYSIMFQSGER